MAYWLSLAFRIRRLLSVAAILSSALYAQGETQLTVIHSFTAQVPEGNSSQAPLTLGSDGNLYGTAMAGGPYACGTVFQITPGGTLSVLHAFGYLNSSGTDPEGALVQGTNAIFMGQPNPVAATAVERSLWFLRRAISRRCTRLSCGSTAGRRSPD